MHRARQRIPFVGGPGEGAGPTPSPRRTAPSSNGPAGWGSWSSQGRICLVLDPSRGGHSFVPKSRIPCPTSQATRCILRSPSAETFLLKAGKGRPLESMLFSSSGTPRGGGGSQKFESPTLDSTRYTPSCLSELTFCFPRGQSSLWSPPSLQGALGSPVR